MSVQDTRAALAGVDTAHAWVVTAVGAVVVGALGYLLAPGLVWDRFLWHYFWGPVFADANNAVCAAMRPSGPNLLYSTSACTSADATTIVAYPGYTVVSEIGYAVTLIFFLIGVLLLLRRLNLGTEKGLFFALVPFMFLGGALRVVEDAIDAVPQGLEVALDYPWNTLLISPVIYFTVFFITLGTLLAAVQYARRDGSSEANGYGRPLFYAGWTYVGLTVVFLAGFVLTRLAGEVPGAGFYPLMSIVTLVLAGLLSYGIYDAIERYKPEINAGTGKIGLVVLFGHAVDGVANVIAADWLDAVGVPVEYGAKHPVNRYIVDVTQSVQPETLSAALGTSWPFLVVKLVAATLVVWVFDPEIFDESPRYAILLLIAILAVGLGPGTRDMLRATFGI